MVKQLTITLSDWVYSKYLALETQNRSKLIEEYIVAGAESILAEPLKQTSTILQLQKEIRHKDEEMRQMKLTISSLKARFSKKEKWEAESNKGGEVKTEGLKEKWEERQKRIPLSEKYTKSTLQKKNSNTAGVQNAEKNTK